MKKKFLLTVTAVATLATMALATDGNPAGTGSGSGNACSPAQQVTVTGYSMHSGYEYASRIKRFHTSYVTFDFYSPVYTEVFWYRYSPYTWGVSIYDDWYYYGGNVSRYSWTSGFGGSWWWGYEPWWGYSSRMGYGWNSWDSPGYGYNVNYYLGRPWYHYPVAYSGWYNHRWMNQYSPVTVINNNTYNYYYGSEKRISPRGGSSGYNPPNPNASGRRQGYTATGGRSSASSTGQASQGTTGTQTGTRSNTQTGTRSNTQTGTRSNTQTGTRSNTQTGTRSNTQQDTQGGTQTDKSNNGLRMGQNRRGVAEPAEPGDNGLPRTNNPNINDRTNPGREQSSADRAPVRASQRQQVQNTVRNASKREETVMRQRTPAGTSQSGETSARQGGGRKTETTSETTGKGSESKKTTSSSPRRR